MKQTTGNGSPPDPLLTVVIPVHNNLDQTHQCLDSLSRQQVGFPFRVLLVDDGSDPESAATLHRWGVDLVTLPENRGYPAAVNAGVAATTTELILVLNNDTILPTQALERMVRALRNEPGVGLVGPSSDRVKGAQMIDMEPVAGDPALVEKQAEFLAEQYDGKVEDVFYIVGMAMLFSRSLWDQVGGFDLRFGLGNFEDDDFCLQVRDLGWRIVIARDTFIHHQGGSTFGALGVDYRALLDRNQELYLSKWQHHPVLGAYVARLQHDFPRALFNCRAALTAGTRNHEALHLMGEVLLELGHPQEALTALEQVLKLAPKYTKPMLLKTLALINLDREKAARQAMAALLLDFYMDDRTAARMLSFFADACLDWRKTDEARGYFSTALELHPRCQEAICGLAACALERGDRGEARELLERARESDLARAMLGSLDWEEGNLEEARNHFADAIRINPRQEQSLTALMTLAPDGRVLADALEENRRRSSSPEVGAAAERARRGDLAGTRQALFG